MTTRSWNRFRKANAVGLAVGALALVIAACGSSSPSASKGTSASTEADAKGTLTYATAYPLTTFNNCETVDGDGQGSYISMVYDNLVTTNPASATQIIPDLASSWTVNTPTEYTFTLRTGVTFQDGSAFNATTAAESIEHCMNAGGPRSVELTSVIKSVQAINPTTLRIDLKVPDPDFLLTMASEVSAAILSPKAFDRSDLKTVPDGTGPYVYDPSQSVPGDHYTFTANPHYWDKSAQRVHTIVFKVLTDETATLNALKTGQVDVGSITAADAAAAKSAGLEVAAKASSWYGIKINDLKGKEVPALGSQLVRQAISYAINRDAIVKATSYGYAIPSAQVFAKGTPGYDPSLDAKYAYNPAKAKQLIAESGFKNISFTIPVDPPDEDVFLIIKQELAAVGITMKLLIEPTAELNPIGRTTKYPVLIASYPNTAPFSRYVAIWSPDATWNPFHDDNPVLDQLQLQLEHTTTPAQQNPIAEKMNEEIVNDGLAIVVSQPDTLVAYSPKVKGVELPGLPIQDLHF